MPVFQSPNILVLFLGFLGIDAIIKQEEVLSAKREVSFHISSNGSLPPNRFPWTRKTNRPFVQFVFPSNKIFI